MRSPFSARSFADRAAARESLPDRARKPGETGPLAPSGAPEAAPEGGGSSTMSADTFVTTPSRIGALRCGSPASRISACMPTVMLSISIGSTRALILKPSSSGTMSISRPPGRTTPPTV